MRSWLDILAEVEALEELPVRADLVADFAAAAARDESSSIHFYTPTFKAYASSEIRGCGRQSWPAVSITGGECKLKCDHCKAKVLEPMIAARTPAALWQVVESMIGQGAKGMLLTGGSNHRDEVEYDPFYPTVRRIKDSYPDFRIAAHTALVDADKARRMEDAGIDVAMMDVIGAQETVTHVYHLKRPVADFERALEALVATRMKVVPHIVIGLHYGRLLGEWGALDIVARHRPDALVLVVVMPFYAPARRPFATPDPHEVGRFLLDARTRLPDLPLLLGCARPPGQVKVLIDAYAVMAGVTGMAHPSEGIVELAARMGRSVRVTPACCSIAVGEEVMALDGAESVALDLDEIVRQERERSRSGLKGIPVTAGGGCTAP
ncbi:radical SAM protein [Sulfurifustis variabilis]|uniref:Radical SAM protein n=1 Tax=Sulfurifustis variabilis TaxID=1675686 RepID=A0A1B4VA30_9GAMM|nr:radical SAM protein [Sulfurifustis variabilis]BAU49542.1 radical SAM protein [Sulfurifustis variabilis]